MARKQAPDAQIEARMGRRVNRRVSVLLGEIEKESVPERLLKPARDLEKALDEKLGLDRSAEETLAGKRPGGEKAIG